MRRRGRPSASGADAVGAAVAEVATSAASAVSAAGAGSSGGTGAAGVAEVAGRTVGTSCATANGCHPAMRRRGTFGAWTGPEDAGAACCGVSTEASDAVAAMGADVPGAAVFATLKGCHPTMRRRCTEVSCTGPVLAAGAGSATGWAGCTGSGGAGDWSTAAAGAADDAGATEVSGSAGGGATLGASWFSTASGRHPTMRRFDISLSFDEF